MFQSVYRIAFVLCIGLFSASLQANPIADLRASIGKRFPASTPVNIEKTPIPGLYEVTIGARLYYFSANGRYLIRGTVIDLDADENLTRPRLDEVRKAAVDAIGEDNMIVYKAPDEQYVITVFTDIDCGYCRKLHADLDKYLAQGISVRYLFYPRAGFGSKSYYKAVQVWCSKDRKQALSAAKAGKGLDAPTDCKNPVRDHMVLADDIGIHSTPNIMIDSGEIIRGYVPAADLAKELRMSKLTASR